MNFKLFKIIAFSNLGVILLIFILKIIPYTHPFIKEIEIYLQMVIASTVLILTIFFHRTYFPFEKLVLLDNMKSNYILGIKVNKKTTDNYFTILFYLAPKSEYIYKGFSITKEISRRKFLKLTNKKIKKITNEDITNLITYYGLEYLKPCYVKTKNDRIKAERIYKLKNL